MKKGLKERSIVYIVEEAKPLTRSEDGRVVKAEVLRSSVAIRVGSIPTPRNELLLRLGKV
jgi:hypothetical protein